MVGVVVGVLQTQGERSGLASETRKEGFAHTGATGSEHARQGQRKPALRRALGGRLSRRLARRLGGHLGRRLARGPADTREVQRWRQKNNSSVQGPADMATHRHRWVPWGGPGDNCTLTPLDRSAHAGEGGRTWSGPWSAPCGREASAEGARQRKKAQHRGPADTAAHELVRSYVGHPVTTALWRHWIRLRGGRGAGGWATAGRVRTW